MGRDVSDPLAFLGALGGGVAAAPDPEAAMQRTLEAVTERLGAEAGALFVHDADKAGLVCCAAAGVPALVRLRADARGLVARCAGGVRPMAASGAGAEPGFRYPGPGPIRSALGTPLRLAGRRLGALVLFNKRDGTGFDEDDVALLAATSGVAALALFGARVADAQAEQERVRGELEVAAEIQRSLLPKADPLRLPVVGINRPIRRVSGDFFDYFRLPDARIPFALGDVAGKGMNAALLMAKTASLFRCLGKTIDDPAALLSLINREICETASRGMFVTMVAGLYEPWTGRLRFANAGHEPPLLRRVDRTYESFPAEVPPLGILPDVAFESREIDLAGGEFYVFSDGLTEYRYGAREELGVDGLIQLLEFACDEPLYDRLRGLLAELERDGWELRDDLTVLAIDGSWVDPAWDGAPPGRALSDGGPEALVEMRFPARPDRLKLVRRGVLAAARMCGFSEAVAQDVVLAVNEACQNVILHAYRGDMDGDMVLEVYRREDGILLRLRDFAPPVDPAAVKPRALDDVRPGGLGTHFIREIMDSAAFLPMADGRGNVLEMVKRTGEAT